MHAHRVPHRVACGARTRLLRRDTGFADRQGPGAALETRGAGGCGRGRRGTLFCAVGAGTRAAMTNADQPQTLEPVHAGDDEAEARQWSRRLVLFLRAMAVLSLVKGLYHWAIVCGIGAPFPSGFDSYGSPYQAATVFFAVIDPVAGVGLWLEAPWGAVVWLTSIISVLVVETLFPQIYGGSMWVVAIETVLLGVYLWLALMAAREQPA